MKMVQAYKIQKLIEFYKIYGRVPKQSETYGDFKLGEFFGRLRRGDIKLTPENEALLEKEGVVWKDSYREEKFHAKVLLLIEYYNNNKALPVAHEKYKGQNIGDFYINIKYSDMKLPNKSIKLLEEAGINLPERHRQKSKDQKIEILIKYYNEKNKLPSLKERYEDINIGNFYSNIMYGKTSLSDEQIRRLKVAGINLEKSKKENNDYLKTKMLIEFYKVYGLPPRHSEKYNGIFIGKFFYSLKNKERKLSKENEELLEKAGIVIDSTESRVMSRVHKKVLLLVEYADKYGHLPRSEEIYRGVKVGQFYHSVKRRHTNISPEDEALLKGIGVEFKSE